MTRLRLAGLAALALGLAACGHNPPRAGRKEAASMEWKGQFSGALASGHRIIESQAEWRAAWAEIGREAPPAPDFKSRFAVAVFLGQRPTGGFRVQWLEPDPTGTEIVVRYRELAPEGMVIQALTQPYAVKLFARTGSRIRVEAARP